MLLMLFHLVLSWLFWLVCGKHYIYPLLHQIRPLLARLRIVLLVLTIALRPHEQPRPYRRMADKNMTGEAITVRGTRAKPEWVKQEVLLLKALMPHSGCRKIADAFNRRNVMSRKMTVGKTYVSNTIRQYYYEIQVLRKHLKNAKPKSVPKNLVWAIDLTR